MVGFERALYTVSEGKTTNICVEIISPQDIGDTVVYLHVFRNPGGVPDDKIEASKLWSRLIIMNKGNMAVQ